MKRLFAGLLVAAALLAPAAEAQQRQNALTWGFITEVETLDPYVTAKRTVHLVIRNVLEHLVMRDAKTGEPRPALATAWRWVDDKTLEFTLRRGVTFHNGEAFDADDVVYTVEYVKGPNRQISFAGADYGYIKGAEKIDSHTVRLHLNAPTPSAIDRLTQTLFVLPNETHAREGAPSFASRPVGTGPFRVAAFEAGRRVELARHEGYYPADWGKPRLDRITVLSIPDPQTQAAELTAGRVDFLWSLQTDQLQQIQGARGITTVVGGSTSVSFLSLDAAGRSGENPMQDKNVRMAIAHAINRQAISTVLRGGSSVVVDAPCHPQQFGCAQDVATRYPYDVTRAKALMRASRHPGGFELSIAAFTDSGPVAEAIVGDLREIGIKGRVDFRETSAWIRDFFGGKLAASVVPWPSSGVYDASAMVPLFFMAENGDYTRDQEIIGWFRQAGSIVDAAERKRLYRLGFEKIAREAFVVPLMTNVTNYAFRSALDIVIPADGYPQVYTAGWKP